MKKECYTVMILDDQLLTTKYIVRLLERLEYITIINKSDDTEKALDFLQTSSVDILFLDMDMPEIMGWEFAALLSNPPVIVTMSGDTAFAFKAQEIGTIGYLSKIPSWNVLRRVVDDAILKVDRVEESTKNGATSVKLRRFRTRKDEVIPHDKIRYAIVEDKDITIFLENSETFECQMALKNLMEMLPSAKFVKISAKEIVAFHAIDSFDKSFVKVKDEVHGNHPIINTEAYRQISAYFSTSDSA